MFVLMWSDFFMEESLFGSSILDVLFWSDFMVHGIERYNYGIF